MKLLARNPGGDVDVSVVLLDWSCRESFHILDYLAEQTLPRSRYEVIWVEYYDAEPTGIARRIEAAKQTGQSSPLDKHLVMQMPHELYYHKHLMYNLGIILARGRIVVFCDSDAIVCPTFLESIVQAFADDPNIVLHLDEVRNNHPSLYPFRSPPIEDVVGFGAINWINGTTTGLLDRTDPLHSRNYGACMAALRDNLIAIGGADMHQDYLGHICGPYEMTWRLVNAGKREVWHNAEWLYHVWHPGQAGDNNFAGPHDGLHLSTRALTCRSDGRVEPYVECPAIRMLRRAAHPGDEAKLLEHAFDPTWRQTWLRDGLAGDSQISTSGRQTPGKPRTTQAPLFGRALRRRARWKHVSLLAAMVWRQLKVKRRAARWSQPGTNMQGGRRRLRKLRALVNFIRRILAYDRYLFRQCWLALAYAAQEGRNSLVLYGQGDAARILIKLSRYFPVEIVAICPVGYDRPASLMNRPTISHEVLARMSETILTACFVDTPAVLAVLATLGVPRERIITLQ